MSRGRLNGKRNGCLISHVFPPRCMHRLDLERASDALLSLNSTNVQHGNTLAALERQLAAIAMEQQTQLDAFIKLQEDFRYNCGSGAAAKPCVD